MLFQTLVISFLELCSTYSLSEWLKFKNQGQSGSCWTFVATFAGSTLEEEPLFKYKILF